MKALFTALFVFGFASHAVADLDCSAERKDGGMWVECADGRKGYLDNYIPTSDIIEINYRVKLNNKSTEDVLVKGPQLKGLLNGQYEKNMRYPVDEKIAPFINRKNSNRTNYQKSDIVRVEPVKLKVSPSIKIYTTTTIKGKQTKVRGYSDLEEFDGVPVPVPGARAKRVTTGGRDGGQTKPASQ